MTLLLSNLSKAYSSRVTSTQLQKIVCSGQAVLESNYDACHVWGKAIKLITNTSLDLYSMFSEEFKRAKGMEFLSYLINIYVILKKEKWSAWCYIKKY